MLLNSSCPAGSNVLAVKVTPEQSLEGENGIELARQLAGLDQLEISGLPRPSEASGYPVRARPERGRVEAGISQQHGCGDDPKSLRRHRSAASGDEPGCADRLLRPEQQHRQAGVGNVVGRDFTSWQRNDQVPAECPTVPKPDQRDRVHAGRLRSAHRTGSRSVVALPVGRGEALSSEIGLQGRRQS